MIDRRHRACWRVLALIIFVNLARGPSSAAAAPAQDPLLSGFTVTSWADANGFRLGTIYAIAQDVDGHLWLGTDTGLLRFDGLRFSPWGLSSDAQLPDARVSALYASPDGSIWVGTSDGGGIYRIRRNQLRRMDAPDNPIQSVANLAGDSRGSVVAVTETGVFRYDNERWERLAEGLPATGLLSAHFNREDQLFVGTTRGLFRRGAAAAAFKMAAPWWTFAATEDSAGRLWTTDIRTGFRLVTEDRLMPPRGNGSRILRDREGHLWVATIGHGLLRVSQSGGSISVQRVAGLLSDAVESLIEDREGNIWAGTTGGLHRLSRRRLTPVDVGFVIATEDTDQGVFAATWRGLMRLYQRDGQWVGEPRSPTDLWVHAVHQDARGRLWMASERGLSRVVAGGLEPIASSQGEAAGLRAIASDKRGQVWVTNGERLFQVSGSRLVPVSIPDSSHIREIANLYGDRTGRLWLTVNNRTRLDVRESDGTFHVAFEPPMATGPGAHSTIHSVFEDRSGAVWIAHGNGLTRLDQSIGHPTVNRSNGLPGNRVWAVVDDKQDGLWLSMDLGIVRLSRKEFDQAVGSVGSRGHRIRYQLYDASDGVAGNPWWNVRASRADDGTLWFVRGGSLTFVDPQTVLNPSLRPVGPVRIESVITSEGPLAPAPDTVLRAGTKRVEINYTAVTLTSPTKVRFRYRLDGFDTEWVDAGSRREAVYTNLAPREYAFRVEALSVEGTWEESTAQWRFRIAPRFYQTRTFYMLSGAVIVLGALAVWRLRLGLVRRQFALVLAERMRISQEVHDTLLQSLVGLSLQFDDLYYSVSRLEADIKTRILRARQLIQAHIREARHSIAELRSPVLEVEELKSGLQEFTARATAGSSTAVVFTVHGQRNHSVPMLEKQMLRIGKEAITNAVRHARARQIVVDLRIESGSMRLRVSDDGCGFDLDAATNGNRHYGLIMMRERAEQVGGTLTVRSMAGHGTTVDASIPLPRQ